VKRILVRVDRRVKLRLRRLRRQTRDKASADRCQVVLLAAKGRSRPHIAEAVGCSVSWVGRVLARLARLRRGGAVRPPRGQRHAQARRGVPVAAVRGDVLICL
jgi:hypothetical protein